MIFFDSTFDNALSGDGSGGAAAGSARAFFLTKGISMNCFKGKSTGNHGYPQKLIGGSW